ncbi:MAG: efflux RND transporter periplasmic adaptor subunit [Chloroflexi bacterium]|nr:efflux RND transporter periplasmic adaptor subunit [Chloroflexota bacterium]
MNARKIAAISLLLPAVLVTAACNPFDTGGQNEVTQQIAEVSRGDLTVSVSGSGNIEVAGESKLAFGVGGKIDKIYVEEGDEVSKGQELARLDSRALELAATQAETALKAAEYNLVKARNRYSSVEISSLELAVAQARMALAQAEVALEASRLSLNRMEDVAEAKDDVTDAELEVKAAEAMLKEATQRGDNYEIAYWRGEFLQAQLKLAEAGQDLADLLAESEYAGLIPDELTLKKLQLKGAEQSVEQAQKSLEHALVRLDDAKTPDKDEVELRETQAEAARKSLEYARSQLDDAVITAPFAGTIASITADEGDTVAAAKTIIHLVDLTTMQLVVDIDEIDMPNVKLNQKAIISVDALPGTELEGRVSFIPPLGREESGLVFYQVKVSLAISEGIRPGMRATADIVTDERQNVLLVPSRTVKRDSQGNTFVEVVGEQTVARPVAAGISDDTYTEIISGLREGEKVLVERRARTASSSFFSQ